MQIALHVGAHCTDDEKILRCLGKNRDDFAATGICVPRPAQYRKPIRNALHEARNSFIGPETRQTLLSGMIGDDTPERVAISHQHFICMPQFVLDEGKFYPMAVDRLSAFAQIFNED